MLKRLAEPINLAVHMANYIITKWRDFRSNHTHAITISQLDTIKCTRFLSKSLSAAFDSQENKTHFSFYAIPLMAYMSNWIY